VAQVSSTRIVIWSGAFGLAAGLWAQQAFTGAIYPEELFKGWLLALTQGLIAVWIDTRALRGNPNRFMVWGILAQNLRVMALIGILVLVFRRGMLHFTPFMVAVLAGFLAMLAGQVWWLHKRTT
jgi:hypothetical protein